MDRLSPAAADRTPPASAPPAGFTPTCASTSTPDSAIADAIVAKGPPATTSTPGFTVIRLDGAFAGPPGPDGTAEAYWILTIILRTAFVPIRLDARALDALRTLLAEASAGQVRWHAPVTIGTPPPDHPLASPRAADEP